MSKKRSKESYYGNTEEMIRRQRSGLIPGGMYQKRKIQEARYNCWWEYVEFEDKQSIYGGCLNFDNLKDFKAIHKKELESEKWLDSWWVKVELRFKKDIYKVVMETFTKEQKISIYKQIEECLKKKLAVLEKG